MDLMEDNDDFRCWNELIPDALGLIFKNLSLQEILTIVPRVCKSWRRTVTRPYCWRDIDIEQLSHQCRTEHRSSSSGKHCKLLMGLRRTMHPLEVIDKLSQDDEAFAIAMTMPKLKQLEVAYPLISTEGVLKVLETCPELELLDVRGCWNVKLDQKFIKKFSRLKVVVPLVVDYLGMKGCDYCSNYSVTSGYLAWDFVTGNVGSDYDDEISDGDRHDDQSMEDVEIRFYDGFDLDDAAFDWPLSP
ncbi:EPIDERMAL PATTERNING FACTOR-like protein 1-like [Hibiscus syriacus]|uniref:EPIDERMAL PATTERNING FACTOR-like protein 1-like n=1 Tax=Hibiscus syriacus TaxID=106335 RepID=A0A6A2ZQA4_HIBSY|nr:EPIDERMAL PATTERNING FACTOR-like protein 1-like [Hibiscus syriacus]